MTDLAKTNVYCSILGFISSKYNQARKISGLGNWYIYNYKLKCNQLKLYDQFGNFADWTIPWSFRSLDNKTKIILYVPLI